MLARAWEIQIDRTGRTARPGGVVEPRHAAQLLLIRIFVYSHATRRHQAAVGRIMRPIAVLLVVALALLHLRHVSSTAVADQAKPCRSSLDCCGSPCSDGACKCNHGYAGPFCCALALGECSVALHPNKTWTWGAAPRWTATGAVEVMAMGLRNRCGINNCALQIPSACVLVPVLV